VIATGSSTAHIRAIADAVAREARRVAGTKPEGACFDVQGRDSDDWMLVDLQQVLCSSVSHICRSTYF
jgi:ribosomal silencing factor RsfS